MQKELVDEVKGIASELEGITHRMNALGEKIEKMKFDEVSAEKEKETAYLLQGLRRSVTIYKAETARLKEENDKLRKRYMKEHNAKQAKNVDIFLLFALMIAIVSIAVYLLMRKSRKGA